MRAVLMQHLQLTETERNASIPRISQCKNVHDDATFNIIYLPVHT